MSVSKWPEREPGIVKVEPLEDFRLSLTFNEGTTAIVDMKGWVVGRGGVFEPLSDPEFFRKVRLSQVGGTIEWPGEIDLCPDVLYSRATGIPIPFATSKAPSLPR